MAKSTRVRDQDKFMLRLPDGMRDRIKLKADRAGMSMNEAVVWCLEQHFPAPHTFAERLEDVADLIALMKSAGPDYAHIDAIYNDLREALDGVAHNRIEAPKDFAQMVSERLLELDIADAEEARDRAESPFDDGGDLDEER